MRSVRGNQNDKSFRYASAPATSAANLKTSSTLLIRRCVDIIGPRTLAHADCRMKRARWPNTHSGGVGEDAFAANRYIARCRERRSPTVGPRTAVRKGGGLGEHDRRRCRKCHP